MDVSVVAPVGHEGDEGSGQGREGARATHKERETTVGEESATPPSGFPHASGELKKKMNLPITLFSAVAEIHTKMAKI